MQAKIYEYFSINQSKQILICDDDKEAFLASNAVKFAGKEVYILPDFRAEYGDDLRSYYEELVTISRVLSSYYESNSQNKIIISPIRTLLHKLPAQEQLNCKKISFGDTINLNEFKDEILRLGYSIVDIVQMQAEVSFRGDVIDIFCVNSDEPYRILFDENLIESIRIFDIDSQLSDKAEIEEIKIAPFLSFMSDDELKFVQERVENFKTDTLINDLNSLGFWVMDGFVDYLTEFECILVRKFSEDEFFTSRDLSFLQNFDVVPEAKVYKDLNVTISRDFFELHQRRTIKLLARNSSIFESLDLDEFQNIQFMQSEIYINLISSSEIILSANKPVSKKRAPKKTLAIDELRAGDYVVHQDYGIGKFSGLELIVVLGRKREFVSILYQNNDKLLLPVENLNMIDRYIASDIATLDKLGKASFLKIKEKVREKLFAIASKIIQMAAKRELVKGITIENNDPDYAKFLQNSGFIYTKDQDSAVGEILSDLRSGKIMDRLLSGDVGFGKTEVAMNAIFATVKSGHMALFFVPTTLLCSQHYTTLKERLDEFGIEVCRLDRFASAKEKSNIKKHLEDGRALVCVGTHALLSIKAKNVGLVIIDEEHKFGVKQKEKLKEISANSHVLSMSATPIPRSLNMALSTIKSYSVLTTPPEDRLDIRTIVKEWDEKIIKEAILREVRRGGQVFYLHNHIATIEIAKKKLLNLIPSLKILTLHSKIEAKTTEDEMIKFEQGKYNVMICTSIVESGIHLPNANTIIINDANKFGIADLHQLRGRVGRSNKQGYCYFLIESKDVLSEDALKRLVALESNSSLGSGAILAYHDLEIRGGGNLIGEAQSGHIEAIGYALYLRMLEDEINQLLNKKSENFGSIELKISVNAFLNEDYIAEDRLRLDLYRRLSKCENSADVYEISAEMEDRFGKMDVYTKQFVDIIIIKVLAINLYIKSITNADMNIVVTYSDKKVRLKSRSKDDDDILAEILTYLRKESR